jgi:hypothetical protein
MTVDMLVAPSLPEVFVWDGLDRGCRLSIPQLSELPTSVYGEDEVDREHVSRLLTVYRDRQQVYTRRTANKNEKDNK